MSTPPHFCLLRQLWAEVLEEEEDVIKDDDDFFDLGGDSLTASELVDAAEERGLIFTIEDLFNNPTLNSLAAVVAMPSQSSNSSHSWTTSDWASDGVSSSDETPPKTDTSSPPPGLPPNSWPLTPRQKQLVDSGCPLEKTRTWRRVQLNVEAPLARIQQAFDDIVKAQLACRARIHPEAKDTFTAEKDFVDVSSQYRFRHSLYCNLSKKAIRSIEGEGLDSINPEDGPVYSVDVYRSEDGPHLFLAASSLFLDESSWDIILDDFDRVVSERSSPISPLHEIWELSDGESLMADSHIEIPSKDLSEEHNEGFWGIHWKENRPDISVPSAADKPLDLAPEDAVLHVLQTFGARFGRFIASITLEGIRPKGLEHTVGNFQKIPVTWVTEQAESANTKHPHWASLRQHIQKALHETCWVTFDQEFPRPSELPAPADLSVYVRLPHGRLRTEGEYEVISNVHGPRDKPQDFHITPMGFVELDLCISAQGTPRSVCIFDSRNRQVKGLQAWAEDLWNHRQDATTFFTEGLDERRGSSGCLEKVVNNLSQLQSGTWARRHVSEDAWRALAAQCDVAMDQIDTVYPCSPMQESLTVEIDGDVNPYVMQLVFKMRDHSVMERFRTAWEATSRANAVLRTHICRLAGSTGYSQAVIAETLHWQYVVDDLDAFLQRDIDAPMSLGSPFFRYTILEDSQDSQERNESKQHRYFIWTVHHALCDGASILMILDEVAKRFHDEKPWDRKPFETFIHSSAINPNTEQERAFWHRALSELDPTPYPQVPPSPEFRAAPTSSIKRQLTLDRVPAYGITKALFLRAVWAILMSHYTGTEDVCFGAVNGGRTAAVPGIAHITGPTINVAPVAVHIDPREAISLFFSRFRAKAAEMIPFEHSGVSKIRRLLAGHHATAADFQTLFVVHPENFEEAVGLPSRKLGIEYLGDVGRKEQHPYPLVLSLTLSSATTMIDLHVQYDERVISTQQAHILVHHFQTLLTELSEASPDTLLGSISPLSDFDIAQIAEWNSFTPPIEETCVDQLFHERVVERPDAVAVCSTTESLTYLQVDTQSSSLATRLIDYGVQPGQFVGVCFEKSIWTVVSIMAVFKAGAIYVPIDPAHPKGRISEVVNTIQLQVALASPSGAKVLDGLCAQLIIVDGTLLPGHVDAQPLSRSTPTGIAYLLFTSGSTGKPKGILISHAAICTSIKHHGIAFGAGPHWRTFQFCAHTFDMSIGEFLTTLCYGGCICVPSEEDRMSDLPGAITALRANTMLVVPTVANLLRPEDVPTLKTLVLGGEPVTRETVARWAAHVDLTCSYGPSETSVWCAANLRVSPDAHPGNIGRNIGGTMWIANPDNYQQLTAVGCVGEVVISGAIVGQGYFGDQATTDAAFVPTPRWMERFGSQSPYASPDCRVYKSGDLARYNPDGTLNIVGRLHTQVKLRGFRIELGEIENQIMTTGAVTAALAALPRKGPCANQIVAVVSSTRLGLEDQCRGDGMIVPEGQNCRRPVIHKLKSHLEFVLPHYMVPTVWVVVARLPLLISGKVDRKAIQSWIEAMDQATYSDITEKPGVDETSDQIIPGSLADTLRGLWSDVLSTTTDRIGLQTSFFSLGGDSLAAMRVANQAKALGLSVTARSMISNTNTLGNLVTLVERTQILHDPNAGTDREPQIDWEAETALPQLSLPPPMRQEKEDESKLNTVTRGLSILLTGSTGFFGRAVARMLQAHPSVGTVHCLAVRDTNSTAARQLVHTCPKVQLHPGDLSQPRLGLSSEAEARCLFAEADAIVHNGAEVSFLKGYEALRPANVGSTRELIRLSVQYGRTRLMHGEKRTMLPNMHYVSGTGVAALALLPHQAQSSEVDLGGPISEDPVTDGIIKPFSLLSKQPPSPISPVVVAPGKLVNIDGYVASKWASEVLVERAAVATATSYAANGIWDGTASAYVYRLSNVTGPDAPEMDLMHNLLTKSRAMKAVPRLTGWSGRFDFVRVETAAEALVERLVRSLTPPAADGQCNDKTESISTSVETAQSVYSSSVQQTPSDGSPVEFVHLTGEDLVPVPQLKAYLERETGETFEELDLEDWLARAVNFNLPEPVGVFLSTLVGEDTGPFLPSVESSIL